MPGEGESTDVRIRLVTDDRATITVEQLREALKGSSEEIEKAEHKTKSMGGELLKASLYTKLISEGAGLVVGGFHEAYELSEKLADSAMETADELNQQVRSMSGLEMFMDRGAHSMEQLRGYAGGVREELAHAGTAAGVSTQQMVEMFDHTIERGGMATEEAKELTVQMAMVGKVVPGGAAALAEGFSMMELGIVRARNPLVQLIAATGTLKGNAHDVAKEMMKMTPAHQMELAQKAISAQAANLQAGGGGVGASTLGELRSSFGNIREGFLEAVGQPLLDRVVPSLSKLRDYLMSHSKEIAQYGEDLGQRLGDVVEKVEGLVGDVYSGAVRDWAAIKRELTAGANEWKQAWTNVMGDGRSLHEEMKDMASEVASVFHMIALEVRGWTDQIANLKDFFSASNIANEFMGRGFNAYGHGENESHRREAEGNVTSQAARFGNQGDFETSIDKYRAWAKEAGQADADVDKFVQAQRDFHEAEAGDMEKFKGRVESADAEGIAAQIQKARELQDNAFLGAALDYVGHSDAMTKALMDGSIHVQGGFDALKEVIERSAPELAERMKKIQREAFGPKGIEGHGPTQIFNGGIHIKQDFRDADPDRIIQVFRRDLASAADNRRQARTAAFGGL